LDVDETLLSIYQCRKYEYTREMLEKFREQAKTKSQGSSQTNSTTAFGGQFGGLGANTQAAASDGTIDVSVVHTVVMFAIS
jgi:hypothetical protein